MRIRHTCIVSGGVSRRQELHRLHVHGQGRHDQQDQANPHAGRRRYDEQERCGLHRHRVRRGASARPQPWRACPPADRHRAPRLPRRVDLRGQKARHYDLIPQYKACCPYPTDGRLFSSRAFCIRTHTMVTRVSSRNQKCAKALHLYRCGDCSFLAAGL